MRSSVKLFRNLILIVSFCLVFTASFSMPVTEQAYAISGSEEVYDPYEYENNYRQDDRELLRGTEVPVSKTYQALIQYNISTGGTKYKGSGECWGYANKVKSLFGGGGRTRYVRKKTTPNNVYNALRNVKPGTHVRFGNSKTGSGRHSIAVYKVTKDRIYFSDGNWGYANQINHYNMSLEAFCDYHGYKYIMWYIQPTGSYKTSSAKVVTATYDQENKVDVAWKPVSGASSYTVYRASSKNGSYTKLKTVKSPLYTDKNPKPGNNYYKVKPNNKKMSSPKKAFNRLVTPIVKAEITKNGYTKLTWNEIKGAIKYKIYKSQYNEDGESEYKLLKTVTGTGYTFKDKGYCGLRVKAVASNTKANSKYNEFYVARRAPQPVILNGSMDEASGDFVIDLKIPYSLSDFETVNVEIRRSTSKNGEYERVGEATAYSVASGDEYDYNYSEPQYGQNTFDPETSIIKVKDTSWEENTTYYYKAVAYGDWEEGLDSKVFQVTTPSRPVVDVKYGSGTLHRYLGGKLIYYIDYDGTKYTKGLSVDSSYLYYTDNNGKNLAVEEDGTVWELTEDSETGMTWYDWIGNNTDSGYPDYNNDDSYDDTEL